MLRGGGQSPATARRLRLPARVWSGKDRPRSAGASNPGRDQRNHAGGHRPGRGLAVPRNRLGKDRMTSIAFLGLGNMGGPMSANLVAAGHAVRGFDPVPAAATAAAGNGVTVFDSAAGAVAEADVVITMLPNGDLVKRCYADILPAARRGALFIDSSTIS